MLPAFEGDRRRSVVGVFLDGYGDRCVYAFEADGALQSNLAHIISEAIWRSGSSALGQAEG